MTNEYAIFAARFQLTANQATVLPALFEHAAKKVGMGARALLNEATYNNRELGDYLARLTEQVAQEAE